MRYLLKTILATCFTLCFSIGLFAQIDSSRLSINLYSSAFFDNKEFTGNIKKGYTTPGFFLQPTLKIESDRFKVNVGFHMIYIAGTDSLEKFVPYLSLLYNVSPSLKMLVGNIDSKNNHLLPESIFKTERYYLNQPELGVEFKMNTPKFTGDLWINWERYIETGSPFQEQFTVGLVTQFKPSTFEPKTGLYTSAIALATHQGGQIDSTNLPVTTLINAGATLGHKFSLPVGNAIAGIELSGYVSSDKSPSPHTKFKNGKALHPKFLMEWPIVRLEIGYWYAQKFVNPRGEELYGSTSTINETLDEKNRELITIQLSLSKKLQNQFTVCTGFNAYIDTKNGTTEYSYAFRMIFDGEIIRKP